VRGRRALSLGWRAWSLHGGASHISEELHPLSEELVGATARVLDDAIGFGLCLAPDQLRLAFRVAEESGRLGLGCAYDRLDALGRVPRKVPKVVSVHASTVSPLEKRQYRTFV
jgi:hypothetical protein